VGPAYAVRMPARHSRRGPRKQLESMMPSSQVTDGPGRRVTLAVIAEQRPTVPPGFAHLGGFRPPQLTSLALCAVLRRNMLRCKQIRASKSPAPHKCRSEENRPAASGRNDLRSRASASDGYHKKTHTHWSEACKVCVANLNNAWPGASLSVTGHYVNNHSSYPPPV
jgi:hypothetical protein